MLHNRYGAILKSTVFSGGSQIVAAVAAIVRAKVAALTIGVEGIGILGLYSHAAHLISEIAALGLASSAVREVALANASQDRARLAQVIFSLRFIVLATGLIAAAACMLLAPWLSTWTFGDQTQQGGFLFVGAGLFLGQVSAGQTALLRGLGLIRQIALQQATVAIASTVAASACYLVWGIDGVAPSLLAVGFLTLIGSWWYARRVEVQRVVLTWRTILSEGKQLLGMGLAFMWVSLVSLAVAYLIGIIIRSELGVQGNGIYQAAWGISGYIVGFVLAAMGQDFYPRLTGVIDKKQEAGHLLNAQTEMGILLALPGMVAISACAPWAVSLLFAPSFSPAADAVAWFTLGCFGRVVSWPLSYVLMARSESVLFAGRSSAFALLNLFLSWVGLRYYGITGVALGFAGMHFWNFITLRFLVGRRLAFNYSRSAARLITLGTACLVAAPSIGPWAGLILSLALGCLSLRLLAFRLGASHRLIQHATKFPPARWLLAVRVTV